jgi:hypothetical protein
LLVVHSALHLPAHPALLDSSGDVAPIRTELPATCHVTVPSWDTSPGQSLLLVGSIPQLGEWNPEAGLALSTSGDHGFWEGSLEVPLGTCAEAKVGYKQSMCGERRATC